MQNTKGKCERVYVAKLIKMNHTMYTNDKWSILLLDFEL